ncbi:hypothetical protein KBY75_14275 [Cyanobium sp. T1G-Tous]|uniref:hypothetical protein n=1 Tax=Cyanobium sp. T1G-Tous TaxID=2823722 RepID=UPI0020CCD8E8|nr:hypothetical protein [Cyanobium sp. T1G-Tous]MCP9804728.1 hypothetical protein [Cyanobium sp. T1G-Tous]
MNPPLIFVVAPALQLPDATTSHEVLQQAQAAVPSTGFALRIFNRGAEHPDLELLPLDGRLTGEQRRSSDGTQLLCAALVVRIEPRHHWLGVYQGDPEDPTCLRCLDRVALSELSNATCWFYPTHDGTFLSWERGLHLTLKPGSIVDCPEELSSAPYDRSLISVLWSLLGSDPMATWGRFRVDNQAEHSLVVEDCLTVFPAPPLAG